MNKDSTPDSPDPTRMVEEKNANFRKELEAVINRYSMENGSDTPDFILAEYFIDCLGAFDKATNRRERWYGRGPDTTSAPESPPRVDSDSKR